MIARRSAAFGVGVAALAFLTVATPLFGAGREEARSGSFGSRTQSFTGSQRPHRLVSRAATKRGAGTTRSFYYYNGRPVWLERSQSELSVRFSTQATRTDRTKLDLGLSTSMRRRASRLRGRDLARVSLKRGSNAAMSRSLARLRARRNVDFAYPVWIDSKRGGRLLLTDEVIVRLKRDRASAPVREMLNARGLTIVREIAAGSGVFVLRLSEPKKADPLAVSRALYRSGLVNWAEPNFVQELQKDYLAGDPLFAEQWYLNNSGQNGATVGADARLAGAWDLEKGDRAITIAVIDDGVQLSHPDLAPNIYTNQREIPGNGVDDDLNGYPDDVHGWNFLYNNKNVNPSGDDEYGDNHGTAVAGVAAARGDNGAGISGACPNCTILPVKISDDGDWADDSSIASAIVYAGTMADVLNISWGGSESSAVIEFALQYANTIGREGKGAVIVASSGNAGSGYFHYTLEGLPPDTYRFRWVYSKDRDDGFGVGADSAWLAWVRFPGDEIMNFEQGGSSLPPGWLSGGNASWSPVNDPEHADEGRCWSYAAKAGRISNDQQTYIELVKTLPMGGKIDFLAFVSSEMGVYGGINGGTGTWPLDGLRLWVDEGDDGSWEWAEEGDLYAGVPPLGLVYPAAFPQPIAVGATTSFDCRAAYSQFGPELDLVVPSSGGGLSSSVVTTDRTGAAGYGPGDYFSDFGGTSSAAPLAAGVVGLILSRNPGLTATSVREILESSAEKVNRELAGYDANGHSDRYGYGRIDAQRALRATPTPSIVSFTRTGYRVREGRAAAVRIRRSGNTALAATVRITTLGRTAKSIRDFRIVTQKVRFAPGQRLKAVAVPTVDDDVHEPTEQLYLKLSLPSSGAVLRTRGGSQLKIIDGDRRFGELGSASLSQTVFEPEQARSVRLSYRFTRPCGMFRYVLSRNEGGKWKALRGSRRVGDFVGAHTLTAKTLFAGVPIATGQYRVKLFADTNSKRLVFTIS